MLKPLTYPETLLQRLLADLPQTECNDFHHPARDQHEGFACPCKIRFDRAVKEAQAYIDARKA